MTSVSKLRRPIVVCVGLSLVAVIGCAPKPPSRADLVRSALTWAEERAVAARDPQLMADVGAGWAAVDRRHSEEIFARARQAALDQVKDTPTSPVSYLCRVAVTHAQADAAHGAAILRAALDDMETITARVRATLPASAVEAGIGDRVEVLEALAEFAPKEAELRARRLPGRHVAMALDKVRLTAMMRVGAGRGGVVPTGRALLPDAWGVSLAPGAAHSQRRSAALIGDAVRRQIARDWKGAMMMVNRQPDVGSRAWCWVVLANNVNGQRRALALRQATAAVSAYAARSLRALEDAQSQLRAGEALYRRTLPQRKATWRRLAARSIADAARIPHPSPGAPRAEVQAYEDRVEAATAKWCPVPDAAERQYMSAYSSLYMAVRELGCFPRACQWALLAVVAPTAKQARACLAEADVERSRRPGAITIACRRWPEDDFERYAPGVKEQAVIMAAASFVNRGQAVAVFRQLVAMRNSDTSRKDADAALGCAGYLVARIDPQLAIRTYLHGARPEQCLVNDATALLQMGERATAEKLLAAAEKRFAQRAHDAGDSPRGSEARQGLAVATEAIALGRAQWGDGGQAVQLACTIDNQDQAVRTLVEIAAILRRGRGPAKTAFDHVWEVCSAMDLGERLDQRQLPWTH